MRLCQVWKLFQKTLYAVQVVDIFSYKHLLSYHDELRLSTRFQQPLLQKTITTRSGKKRFLAKVKRMLNNCTVQPCDCSVLRNRSASYPAFWSPIWRKEISTVLSFGMRLNRIFFPNLSAQARLGFCQLRLPDTGYQGIRTGIVHLNKSHC